MRARALCSSLLCVVLACGASPVQEGGETSQGDGDGDASGDGDGDPSGGGDGDPSGDGDGDPGQSFVFASGFEPGTQIQDIDDLFGDIIGEDLSVAGPSDWEGDLEGGLFGEFRVYYEGGTLDQRELRLGVDPEDDQNQVLEFILRAPNVAVVDDDEVACNDPGEERKGRIQAVLRQNANLRQLDYSVRMRLDGGFVLLSGADTPITWLTVAEFWNNLPGQDFSFRVTMNLNKLDAAVGTPLSWGLHGQTNDGDGWEDVWTHETEPAEIPVPLGEWFELHVGLVEGDAETGRVQVSMDYAGASYEIIDRAVYTYHPDDPAPDGLNDLNPLKLYTSGPLLCAVADAGESLVVRWDDLVIHSASD